MQPPLWSASEAHGLAGHSKAAAAARANLGGRLEVLAAGVNGHGLHLALLYAERTVHLGPADERRVLEVGPVVGAAGLLSGQRMRRWERGGGGGGSRV